MPLFAEQFDRRVELDSMNMLERHEFSTTPTPLPKVRFTCGSCGSEFAFEAALLAHNYEFHPVNSFYVRANGRIASDLSFIEESLRQLEVAPVGPSDLHLNVQWNDGLEAHPLTVSAGRSIDLVSTFGEVEQGEIRIWASPDHHEHLYRIYVHDAPEFDYATLDDLVFESQLPLLEGRAPAWGQLRDTANRDLQAIEQRYLRGFASYLHGCDLERVGDFDPARRAFESAFRRLVPYGTPLAMAARAILAFRMHAMDLLRDRGEGSTLYQAANFFSVPMHVVPAPQRSASERGIWMDDFQEGLLGAVNSFASGDLKDVHRTIAALPGDLEREPGNALKKAVLTARLARAEGDSALATSAYRQLRDHPVYGPEARAHL